MCLHVHTHKERLALLLQNMNVLCLQDRTSNIRVYFFKVVLSVHFRSVYSFIKTNQMCMNLRSSVFAKQSFSV